jgi:carboxypeptidase D
VQTQITAVDFVLAYKNVFSLPNATLTALIATAQQCGYTGYMEKHVTYPPKGLLPLPGKSTVNDKGCDVWSTIFNAALEVNPAFNVYRIFDVVRVSPWSLAAQPLTVRGSTPSYGTCLASRVRSLKYRRRSTSTAPT